jgi:hypothetical protein
MPRLLGAQNVAAYTAFQNTVLSNQIISGFNHKPYLKLGLYAIIEPLLMKLTGASWCIKQIRFQDKIFKQRQ